jgi:hypothetical protein
LHGRRGECTTLERSTFLARSGQSRVLVLRGEAGIGKMEQREFGMTPDPQGSAGRRASHAEFASSSCKP